jgi:hypothetical protein
LFVSTATVFADYPQSNTEQDENTLITDYWLSFMSARQQEETSEPQRRLNELELKVEDCCRRLNTLSQERITLTTELERIKQGACAGSGPTCNTVTVKPEQSPFAERGHKSLLPLVLSGGGLSVNQKLR